MNLQHPQHRHRPPLRRQPQRPLHLRHVRKILLITHNPLHLQWILMRHQRPLIRPPLQIQLRQPILLQTLTHRLLIPMQPL